MADTAAGLTTSTAPFAEGTPQPWPSQDQALLLRTAREHKTQADAAEADWRAAALEDKRFEAGEQWPEGIKAQRDRDHRPCLTIDRYGTHLRQTVNEGTQQNLGVLVNAVDDVADPETAKKIRGLVRDIEQQSNADIAYEMCQQDAVGIGRGFVRVVPVYVDDFNFRQELRILPIRNVFSVSLDPASLMPDGSDSEWALIVTRMQKDNYERTYRALPAEAAGWSATGDGWISESEVQVAEYWWREWHPMELALLETPMQGKDTVPVAKLAPEQQASLRDTGQAEGVRKTRTTRVPQVWQAKINGYEVLEQTQWLGRYIPIAQEVGEVIDIDGKVDYRGMTRRLKDPQQMANYWFTAFTEGVALAPKNAFVMAWQQREGFEAYWDDANTANRGVLVYEPAVVAGQLLPPPQRSAVEPAVQSMLQGVAMAADHIKAIAGYQDQVQDDDPNVSGEAIRRRSMQTNMATSHFQNHKRWMVRHLGRILVDAIPHYYDEAQTVRILGEDDQAQQVKLNQRHTDEDGKDVLYDVTVGRYDVRIDGGPSLATKRQDAVDKLTPLMIAHPELMQIFGDDYVQSLDVDTAQHMAERIRKTMPPQLLEGEPGTEKIRAVSEQMQQLQQLPALQEQLQKQEGQIAQMMQSVQSLTMDNQQLRLEVQNKERELVLKRQLEEHKLALQAQEQAHEARMAELALEVDRYEARTARLKAEQPATNGRE